jgi:hypothetical protein
MSDKLCLEKIKGPVVETSSFIVIYSTIYGIQDPWLLKAMIWGETKDGVAKS